jgi:hypothetical protein
LAATGSGASLWDTFPCPANRTYFDLCSDEPPARAQSDQQYEGTPALDDQ